MKLTIEGAGQKFTANMPENECREWFRHLVCAIIHVEKGLETDEPVEVKPIEPAEVKAEEVKLAEPTEVEPVEEKAQPPVDEPKQLPIVSQENQGPGYKGFLYIECPDCHETHGFHSKFEMTYYRCKTCGHKSNLPPLVPLNVKCQCGKTFRYMTNKTESMFDMNCLECGCPVSVEYSPKNQRYGTIEVAE